MTVLNDRDRDWITLIIHKVSQSVILKSVHGHCHITGTSFEMWSRVCHNDLVSVRSDTETIRERYIDSMDANVIETCRIEDEMSCVKCDKRLNM